MPLPIEQRRRMDQEVHFDQMLASDKYGPGSGQIRAEVEFILMSTNIDVKSTNLG